MDYIYANIFLLLVLYDSAYLELLLYKRVISFAYLDYMFDFKYQLVRLRNISTKKIDYLVIKPIRTQLGFDLLYRKAVYTIISKII